MTEKRTHHPDSGLPVFPRELHDLFLETSGDHADKLCAWLETVGYTKKELMWEFMYSEFYEEIADGQEQAGTAYPDHPGAYGSHPVRRNED